MPKRRLPTEFEESQPKKRYRTETKEIALSSSKPPSSTQIEQFILQLINEETIKSKCTEETLEKGKNLVGEVKNLLLCDTQRSKIHTVVRLSGVVCSRYNVSILLKQEDTDNSLIAKAIIVENNCTCESIYSKFCEHIVAILYSVYKNGTRSVEFYKDMKEEIENYSKDILAKCITDLIVKRPEVSSTIKLLLKNKDIDEIESSFEAASKVISSGTRKARIQLNPILKEIDVDCSLIWSSILSGFQEFINEISTLCSSECACECHQEMSDISSCLCKTGNGDYSKIKIPINEWVLKVESLLNENNSTKSSNALVTMENIVKEYCSNVSKILSRSNNNNNNNNSENKFDINSSSLEIIKKFHEDHLIRNGKELCWRFALIIVRKDIHVDIRTFIGNSISKWIDDVPFELISYLNEIRCAAFDQTSGNGDNFCKNSLITAARAYEFYRTKNLDDLNNYWKNSNLPFTVERVRQLENFSFIELVR